MGRTGEWPHKLSSLLCASVPASFSVVVPWSCMIGSACVDGRHSTGDGDCMCFAWLYMVPQFYRAAACHGPRLCRDGQAADQERSKGRPAKPDRVCCDCAVFRRRSHRYCSPSHVDQIWCTCSQTALHYATKLANIELMHMLFEKNANPNVADKQGYVH